MNFNEAALKLHEEHHGKIEVTSKVPVKTRDDLSTAYTPGVAEPCRKIHDNKKDVYKYTAKGNLVAVVSDGTAVLGLGNIGPEAAMPVMEGKAVLFKEFGGVDAFPICLDTTDTELRASAALTWKISLPRNASRLRHVWRKSLIFRYSTMTSTAQQLSLQRLS